MQSLTKGTWIANAKRLSIESDALERKTNANIKDDDLRYEVIEFGRNRNESKSIAAKKITDFKSLLSDIQSKIQNSNWRDNGLLKKQLETFENKLTNFKLLMRSDFENLDTAAGVLQDSIDFLTNNISTWETSGSDIATTVDNNSFQRIVDRKKEDIHRKAIIGKIDRKVLLERFSFTFYFYVSTFTFYVYTSWRY